MCACTIELKSWACHSSQSSLRVYRAFSVTQSTGPRAICCVSALTIRNSCLPTFSCDQKPNHSLNFLTPTAYFMFRQMKKHSLSFGCIQSARVSNVSFRLPIMLPAVPCSPPRPCGLTPAAGGGVSMVGLTWLAAHAQT